MPETTLGRWAAALAALALGSFLLFPLITMRYRESYPVTDTWVLPAIMTGLFIAAGVLSATAVWGRGERSLLSLVLLALTGFAAVVMTVAAIGGAIVGG